MYDFLNIADARTFIEIAMQHYMEDDAPEAPGWFINWLDDLYTRLDENWRPITLDEIHTLSSLFGAGMWMPQSIAVNTVYKMFERLKRDTTGITSY